MTINSISEAFQLAPQAHVDAMAGLASSAASKAVQKRQSPLVLGVKKTVTPGIPSTDNPSFTLWGP